MESAEVCATRFVKNEVDGTVTVTTRDDDDDKIYGTRQPYYQYCLANEWKCSTSASSLVTKEWVGGVDGWNDGVSLGTYH